MPARPNLDANGNYVCPRCKLSKPPEDFYKASPAHRGSKSPHCKKCSGEINFETRCRNKLKNEGVEEYRKDIERDQRLLQLKMNVLMKYLEKS